MNPMSSLFQHQQQQQQPVTMSSSSIASSPKKLKTSNGDDNNDDDSYPFPPPTCIEKIEMSPKKSSLQNEEPAEEEEEEDGVPSSSSLRRSKFYYQSAQQHQQQQQDPILGNSLSNNNNSFTSSLFEHYDYDESDDGEDEAPAATADDDSVNDDKDGNKTSSSSTVQSSWSGMLSTSKQQENAIEEDAPSQSQTFFSSILSRRHDHNRNQHQHQTIDDILASKLGKMTMDERYDGLYELHGVPTLTQSSTVSSSSTTSSSTKTTLEPSSSVAVGLTTTSSKGNDEGAGRRTRTGTGIGTKDSSQQRQNDMSEEESTEFISRKVEELDRILLNMILPSTTAMVDDDSSSTATMNDDNIRTQTTPTPTGYAYRLAVTRNPLYVNRFKVPCLRSVEPRWDCYEAGRLLVRMFDRLYKLWGIDKFDHEIHQNMMCSETYEALHDGIVQLLPYRDQAGRAVIFLHGVQCLKYTTPAVMQVLNYVTQKAVLYDDETTQRHGVVIIYWGHQQRRTVPGRTEEYWDHWKSSPYRVVGLHHCMEDHNWAQNIATLSYLLNSFQSRNVCRTKFHSGSDIECIYNLLTYGIPKEAIPVQGDGTMDLSQHHEMLQVMKRQEEYKSQSLLRDDDHRRQTIQTLPVAKSDPSQQFPKQQQQQQQQQQQEEMAVIDYDPIDRYRTQSSISHQRSQPTLPAAQQMKTKRMILVPNPFDVLMGRGRHPKKHPGSLKFHAMIEEYRDRYEHSCKEDKTLIANTILWKMKQTGSRFLIRCSLDDGDDDSKKNNSINKKQEDWGGYYVECDDKRARDKISHGFRNKRLDPAAIKKRRQSNNNSKKKKASTNDDGKNSDSSISSSNEGKKRSCPT